jgi:glycosyltransferase involved in cell wall biosynthesis
LNIGLYQDPRGGGIGGGEYCLAVLARALRAEGLAVDLVHHQGERFAQRISDFFGMDLSGVGDRSFPAPGRWDAPDAPAWRRKAAMRGWMRDASDGYDLFVCTTHTPPPVCHARKGLLYVLFPMFNRHDAWPWAAADRGVKAGYGRVRRWVYERWWRERIESYSILASISEFTRQWTRDYWGIDSAVVYPPVELGDFDSAMAPREDRIAVVGRFTPSKKQAELVRAFAGSSDRLPGWRMVCMGGLGLDRTDRSYYSEIERAADGSNVDLYPNAPRERLRAELARSRVFWHAMGLDATNPEREEHFGIATVEAMAAGCIPLVPDRGGQPEIVTQGETGFLCESLADYVERTVELAADPQRTSQMAVAAHERAKLFSRSAYESRMMDLIRPHLRANSCRA